MLSLVPVARARAPAPRPTTHFTRYGTVSATVASVSGEGVQVESVGLVYTMRVSLDRAAIEADRGAARLLPGMAVTVEVKTGEWRLIEYF